MEVLMSMIKDVAVLISEELRALSFGKSIR